MELHQIKTFRKSFIANFTNLKSSNTYFNCEKIKYFFIILFKLFI